MYNEKTPFLKDNDISCMVSVIIPTFNRPETLPKALKSLQDQSFNDFEAVVINDGGCDIQYIIDSFNSVIKLNYISYNRCQGASAARNKGIRAAKGKYITYLDDDDILYKDHLEILAEFLEKTQFKIAYTDAYRIFQKKSGNSYITVSKKLFHSQDFNRDYLLVASYIAILNVMHEKSCIEKSGYFDETLTSHQDLDLWIRLSQYYDFGHIKKTTAEFIEKDEGESITSSNKQQRLLNLESLYRRYKHLASPEIQYHQKKVLQRVYKNYGLILPKHLI